MKEIVKTSRLAGSLEKIFRMVNADLFNNELAEPVITIQSTPRAYGSYTLYNAWNVKGEGRREINIGAGTLDRPIELTILFFTSPTYFSLANLLASGSKMP